MEVLEEKAGLCRYLINRSSSSDGLHLYFPFPEAQPCLKTAFAIHNILAEAGFRVAPGQLEVFPNIKSPGALYNGHRLPLQQNSYALDTDFQPIHNSLELFVNSWVLAASHQDREKLTTIIEQAKTSQFKKHQLYTSSGDITEWKERLEETLEQGWTQVSQTNRIIKEVCQYAIVFLNQGRTWDELNWSGIRRWVYQTIINLPGYETFCNHRVTIKKRIDEWLRTNQKNRKYTPLGSQIKQLVKSKFSGNQTRQEETLERIRAAIDSILKEQGAFPKTVRERETLIRQTARCGTKTLWKYKELWHPDYDPIGNATDRSPRDSVIATDLTSATANETEVSLQEEGTGECVTAPSTRISADFEQPLKIPKTVENLQNQGVTLSPLLSVDIRNQDNPELKGKLIPRLKFTPSWEKCAPTPRDLQENFFERTISGGDVQEASKADLSTQFTLPTQQTIRRIQNNKLLQDIRTSLNKTFCSKGLDLVSLEVDTIPPFNTESETPLQNTS